MKETVFDVLMYLLDNYLADDKEINSDQEALKYELVQAGFADHKINKAFAWLDGLATQKDFIQIDRASENKSLRIFNAQEMAKLDVECRGFILFLEQAGLLDPHDRELVIDRVMALGAEGAEGAEEIDLQQLQWVVLMVLLNQPGKEAAFTWLEDIVLDDVNMALH